MTEPIVASVRQAAELPHGAAIVLEPLREFLDAADLGEGPVAVAELGDGHSNLTFLLRRGGERFVLRRPPRGELAPSANDVLREAWVLSALANTEVPVPEVLVHCEDPTVIGAPFFVMSFVAGELINDTLPAALDADDAPDRIARKTVEALAHVHGANLGTTGLAEFGKPSGYLERQVKRFASLLEMNATRPLPDLETVADWLIANLPRSGDTTFVHGDFRLGNLIFATPLELTAVLDWEMATVGDPLADLGYLTATWAEAGEPSNPMFELSRVTTGPQFPSRDELARRYSKLTGRSVLPLPWYQVLALWKSAIFLEGSYRRFLSGGSKDNFFARLDEGVPALAAAARESIARFEQQ